MLKVISAPTIERGRRCQSCTHWDNGERAIKLYKEKRYADLERAAASILTGAPTSAAVRGERLGAENVLRQKRTAASMSLNEFEAYGKRMGLQYQIGDNMIRQKVLGICSINATPDDFVHRDYFCDRYKSTIVIEGKDELPEEAKDRLGYNKGSD